MPTCSLSSEPHILQLQSERRHLKRPELDLRFSIFKRDLLPLVLEHVRLLHLLHINHRSIDLDDPPRLAAQALVDPDDDAPSFAVWQFAAGHVFVVFAALDRVEDEGGRAAEADAAEDPVRG